MILVPNIIFFNMPSWFSHFPSTSDGRKGSEIEILIFRQICILALCSKTRDGPWHPLDITFLEFFCIFITFGSKWLRKTSGWREFQKSMHFGTPYISSALSLYCLSLKVIIVLKTSPFYIKKSSEKNSQRRKSHGKLKQLLRQYSTALFNTRKKCVLRMKIKATARLH